MLLVSAFGVAIVIVHDDHKGHFREQSRHQQQRAVSRLAIWLLRCDMSPVIEPFTWTGPHLQDPLRQSCANY